MIRKRDDEFCVYKKGVDGEPEGETRGCHATKEEAQKQMAALYVHVPESASALDTQRVKAAVTKKEADGEHPASHYLVVEDAESPTAWHLRVRDINGDVDHRLMGAAWAALHGGYRGNTYEGPNKEEAIAKLKKLYAQEKMDVPGQTVKAIPDGNDWVLDILAVPFGGPDDRDDQGEWFDAQTNLHEDKYPLPPIVYHHGMTDGLRGLVETPEYIGRTIKRWIDSAGVWMRSVLDKTSRTAQRVWEAAQKNMARASSGTAPNLARVEPNGYIREWPLVEVSVFDVSEGRQPVNHHAVAIPAMKAVYQRAGIAWPVELNEPEAKAEDGPSATPSGCGPPSPKAGSSTKIMTSRIAQGATRMETEQIQQIVADALKAQREQEQAQQAAAMETQRLKAIEDENTRLKAQLAEANRLPGSTPYVAKFADTWKYDNLDTGAHALALGILQSGRAASSWRPPTDAFVKALALKVESEAAKGNEVARQGAYALKSLPIKANEIMYSTLQYYGDEWVGALYSQDLWEKIRAATWVMDRLLRDGNVREIPQGYESDTIPLESTDFVWYKVPQTTTEYNATTKRPNATVTPTPLTTASQSITVAKMGARGIYSGELAEDSLIRFVEQARKQMVASGGENFDHAVINGDTTTSASTNINDIAGTPAGTEVFMLVNGFRKLALVTNTANSKSGGPLSDTDFLETAKLMGTVGLNAADKSKVTFIPDANVYWKALELSTVKTQDVWPNATLVSGTLDRIWGYEVKPSWFMHKDESGVVTSLKVNTAGKLDIDTAANNTTGSILAVRWDQWAVAWKRRMTLEVSRWPESDANQIVALCRWGMVYRDTEASAIMYNVTGI